jgi:hypothetical protein
VRRFALSARAVALAMVGVSVVATLWFALGLLRVRPMMYGEAEVLFEASRIRDHLALFVDPVAGAFDYGPVPTRCQVAYPPLWSWVLSHLPGAYAESGGRLIGTAAWFGGLAWVASRARQELRRQAALAAGVAAGVFVLALFPSTARPDAAALALVGVALARCVRKAEVDAVTGGLLALAAWTKPNVLGVAAGVFLYALAHRPRDLPRAALGGLAVTVPIAVTLHVVSHGVCWQHFTRTLGQPLSLEVWWSHVWTRAMFLAPIAMTTWLAVRSRNEPRVRVVLYAWIASLGWALVSLAKIGSASNYWMEPAISAVAVASVAPFPRLEGARRALFWAGAAVATAWLAIATVGGVLEAFEREPRRAALLVRARAECRPSPDDVVVADNPGTELAVDGRIVAPGLATVYLIREGHLPVATWIADLKRPEVTCLIEQEGLFHALPDVQAAIEERFVEAETVEDWHLYRLRRP